MKLTIAGCGDAFGSGGRLNTCFHVEARSTRFLIDCGASALISMRRQRLVPNDVDTIFISHLHGDHFAGLVFWMLDAQHVSRRTKPLDVAGPPGIAQRFHAAAEALFPGSTGVKPRFELRFHEYTLEQPQMIGGVEVTAYEVKHPSGALSCALRLSVDERTIAFSGDTEWVDNLVRVATGSDLFLCECYMFDGAPRYHLSWQQIETNLERLAAKRIVLTHMSEGMLARRNELPVGSVVAADDGMVLTV